MSQAHLRSILIVVCIGGSLMLMGCGGGLVNGTVQTTSDQIETPHAATTDGEDIVLPQNTETIPSTLESIVPTPSISTVSPTSPPLSTHTGDETQPSSELNGIVIDHRSIELFDSIPDVYLQSAAQMRMIFIDRSVGENIDNGLTCLGYPSSTSSPSRCRRDQHKVPAYNVPASDLSWSKSGGYDRGNWVLQFWSETGCGTWSEKVDCFIEIIDPMIDQFDVVSFQYSYLAVDAGSTIEDLPGGFFWDNRDLSDVYDLEAYEAQHPDKVFIYWTTSLARSIGTDESDVFNQQMRQYTAANDKVLFDVADILSHDPSGIPCYDNRDGVAYDNGNNSENHPDDGVERLAICQHYTTEVEGGHLGSVSAGNIRVAKAFWVLMAKIAGWS